MLPADPGARGRKPLDPYEPGVHESGATPLTTYPRMESVPITLRADGVSEEVYAVPVSPRLYRLEETPIMANREDDPVHAGDVIEVEPLPDGTHRLVRLVERSPMRHFSWTVPRRFVESEEYGRFGAAVEAAGGWWESAFGGLLWVHLPPESPFDPAAELSRRIAAAESRASSGDGAGSDH